MISLLKRFLDDACSVEEAEIVLNFLNTNEGLEILSQLLDEDIEEIEKVSWQNKHQSCNYDKIYINLQKIIENKSKED